MSRLLCALLACNLPLTAAAAMRVRTAPVKIAPAGIGAAASAGLGPLQLAAPPNGNLELSASVLPAAPQPKPDVAAPLPAASAAGRDGMPRIDPAFPSNKPAGRSPAAARIAASGLKPDAAEVLSEIPDDSVARPAADALAELGAREAVAELDLPALFDAAFADPAAADLAFIGRAYRRPMQMPFPQARAKTPRDHARKIAYQILQSPLELSRLHELDGYDAPGESGDGRFAAALVRRFGARHGLMRPDDQRAVAAELTRRRQTGEALLFMQRGGDLHASIARALKEEAAAEASTEYAAGIARRGVRLWRRIFPDAYREVPFHFQIAPKDVVGGMHLAQGVQHTITLNVAERLDEATARDEAPAFLAEFEASTPGRPLQRRISALVVFFHEYAHAIFEEIAIPPEHRVRRRGGEETAYDAMTEGFAVMSELVAVDYMIAERDELGLDARDVEDLARWKRMRLRSLKEQKNHYTFGTVYFFHKLYKRGSAGLSSLRRLRGSAGLSSLRRLRGGAAAMLDFAKRLDWRALKETPLSHPELKRVKGKPELFEPFLTAAPPWHTRQEEGAAASGLSARQLAAMRAHGAGARIWDLEHLLRSTDFNYGGYVLGLSGLGLVESAARAAGLTSYAEAYREMFSRLVERTEEFMARLVAYEDPIVFFVPKDVLTHENAGATRRELEWLLEDPARMNSVYFVFGAEHWSAEPAHAQTVAFKQMRGKREISSDGRRIQQRRRHEGELESTRRDVEDAAAFVDEWLRELGRAPMVRERASRRTAYFQTPAGTFVMYEIERGVFLEAYTKVDGEAVVREVFLSREGDPDAYADFQARGAPLL